MSRFLDYNPFSGAVETFDYDEDTDTIIIKRTTDVTAVIEHNDYLANHTDGWVGEGRDMRLAAKIPHSLAYKWLVEHGVSCWKKDHWPEVRKLLNSNEYRRLRGPWFRL